MSEDKQPMSNDNTPITDAVADAQAEGGLVDWQITVSSRDETGYSAKLTAQGECVMVTEYKHLDNGNTLPWQRGSHADAASALRLVADALSRDPTRRALEIAARLGEASYVLAHCDNNIISARLGRLCQRFGHVVDEHLSAAETQSTIAMINKLSGVVSARFVGSGDDGWKHSWILDALQQARDFFEQAEKEAAEPEELVLTDDMLERMRKRCIHGR